MFTVHESVHCCTLVQPRRGGHWVGDWRMMLVDRVRPLSVSPPWTSNQLTSAPPPTVRQLQAGASKKKTINK